MRSGATLLPEGRHEVGLTLEWRGRGVVLKSKNGTFQLELDERVTKELRNALVEVLGI